MVSQDNESIRQLLSEARSANRAAMGRLAVIVRERMYPYVLRVTLDPDVAEDIVQETLLVVVREIARLRENTSFWPWVYRIAWNKIQDHIRRRRLRSSGRASLALNHSCRRPPHADSLLEAKIHEETLRQVCDGVDRLSYDHRDILRLRYYEQLSYAQIASRARITPKMARARSYRAKKRLKACLV
ncbi:MAG: RNA polymerase sigma factor [Planctomycetota bacterium]|jgi:RNA polymerase sigma-70 factor (ECF subfamily)